jgi:hypothetical protein
MALLECPRCATRFDTIFAAWLRCPYCLARGVDPPPALRSDSTRPVQGTQAPNVETTAYSAVDRLRSHESGQWRPAAGSVQGAER